MKLAPNLNPDGTPVAFAKLMAIEKVSQRPGRTTFRSLTAPFMPGAGMPIEHPPRAFGGHVMAQAVVAAGETLGKGVWSVHSVSSFFILGGRGDLPFVYEVQTVRDGRGYCVRTVNVTQAEESGIVFTCTCSFKLPETVKLGGLPTGPDWQEKLDIEEQYKEVLSKMKSPWDMPDAPSLLMSRWPKEAFEKAHAFPGLYTKLPDMSAFNNTRTPLNRRSLQYYTTVGAMPPVEEAPSLHAAAHLYASDRNSLEITAVHCGFNKTDGGLASLGFTFVFHTPAPGFAFQESTAKPGEIGDEKWFVQEVSSDRLGDGRAIHKSRVWGPDGQHVGTTLQDGLARIKFKDEKEASDVLKGLQSSKEIAKL